MTINGVMMIPTGFAPQTIGVGQVGRWGVCSASLFYWAYGFLMNPMSVSSPSTYNNRKQGKNSFPVSAF